MNIRIKGETPELAGTEFAVLNGMIASSGHARDPWPPAGLSTEIVRRLGAKLPLRINERRIEVDQTNRSVVVDEQWIVKHILGWGASDRACVIERALAQAGSTDAPGFLGALEWDHPRLGVATVALVNRYEPDASDGWTWAPDDVVELIRAQDSGRGDTQDPAWPRELGALVARVHSVLDQADLPHGDRIGVTRESARFLAQQLLDQLAGRDDPAAQRFRARFTAVEAAIDTLPSDWLPAWSVTHGDLHVGQVIRAHTGKYLLLDFDGDPQWGAGSGFRREPRERDIAHMLNSFDLVAVVAQKRLGRADAGVWAWADRSRSTFLRSYMATLEQLGDSLRIDVRALPALSAEQLMLEWHYAARFLPEWEYAPDGAMTHRYLPKPQVLKEDPPWTPPSSSLI